MWLLLRRRKLSVAISSLEDGENVGSVAQQRASLLGPSLRLKEEEDVMVQVLLERDDLAVELEPNPFDPHLVDVSQLARERAPSSGNGRADLEGEEVPPACSGSGGQDGEHACPERSPRQSLDALAGCSEGGETVRSLEEIDARLMDLALDHTWDERCSLADLSVRSSAHVATLRQSVASALQRMGSFSGSGAATASRDASSAFGASSAAPPWAQQRASAGRNVTQLPAIPEREAWSAGGLEASGAESSAGATSHASKRPSKHDKADFLRPMREQRELTSLYALDAPT